MTLLEAAKELLAMIDAVGHPSEPQADRVFAQFEFDNLRAAVHAHDAEAGRIGSLVECLENIVGTYPQRQMMLPHIERARELLIASSDLAANELQMWQRFAGYCRSCALSGENDPMNFKTFVNMPANKVK